MAGLQSVSTLNDGTRVAAEEGLRHTVEKLKGIAPNLKGWEGDPNIEVFVQLDTGLFDVWTLDDAGHPYIALTRPYCDDRLLDDMLGADTRRRDVAAEAKAHNERVDEQKAKQFHERSEEVAEKLQWTLRRAFGHRVFHPFPATDDDDQA